MGSIHLIFFTIFLPLCHSSVLIDVFKYKNLGTAIIFDCLGGDKEIANQKMFQENFVRVTYIHSDKTNFRTEMTNCVKNGVVINTACKNWTRAFNFEPQTYIFKGSFAWIFLTQNLSEVVNQIKLYPVEVDSDVLIINDDDEGFSDIHEIYNTGFETNGHLVVRKLGHWNSKLQMERKDRNDLSGVILKCTAVIIKDIVNQTFEDYLEESVVSDVDSVHKLKYFTVLKYIREMYNLSYNLQRTNSWGYFKNGSFDGMVGALQHHRADIGGSPVFIRGDRAKFIDYVAQTWQTRPCFIMRHPKHPKGVYSIYTRPLTVGVWCSVFGVITLTATILGLMLKVKFLEQISDDTSMSLALLSIWSGICQQGIPINRKATSIQIIIFITLIFSLTLYQYYNATVVSSLLREAPKNIKTLEDLEKSQLKAGIEDVLYNRDFFKRTTDPVALNIFRKKIVTSNYKNFYDAETGMAMVKEGHFAFHVDTAIAYKIMKETFTEREICEAHEVTMYPPQNTGAITKKGSPYKEHIAFAVRKMYESGLMQRLKLIWDEAKPQCTATKVSLFSVSLLEFSMPLLLLILGMVISLIIFLAELVLGTLVKKRVLQFID